jgi:hypothetical protein
MEERDLAVVKRMHERAEQCRRLAAALTDPQAASALVKMAEEVEADIARLEAPNPMQQPPAQA